MAKKISLNQLRAAQLQERLEQLRLSSVTNKEVSGQPVVVELSAAEQFALDFILCRVQGPLKKVLNSLHHLVTSDTSVMSAEEHTLECGTIYTALPADRQEEEVEIIKELNHYEAGE